MIDKDLDNLLSDIKGDTDYDLAREEALRRSRDAARKGDRVGEADDSGTDPVNRHISTLKAFDRTELSRIFGKGILQAVNNHYEFCKSFRSTSLDQDSDSAVEEILRQYKYTFIRSIENIEKLHGEILLALDPRTLDKNARKDFSRYFEGFEEKNRIDFIALRELFVELREFNSLVKKEWSELSRSIGVINLSSAGKNIYQSLNGIIESAMIFCQATDSFLGYLAHVLAVPGNDFDLLKSEVYDKTKYFDYFSYSYGDIFNLDRYSDPDGPALGELPGSGDIPGIRIGSNGTEDVVEQNAVEFIQEGVVPEGEDSTRKNGTPEPPVRESVLPGFTVRGTRSWNTREPYIIRINGERLARDEDDLRSSFYFASEPIDEKILEGELKRGMVRFMRDPGLNVYEEYSEFILKFLFSRISEVADFFEFDDNRALFLYHLGPLPMHLIMIDAFSTGGTGSCFKYITGKRVLRIIPAEFIKKKVLEWYDNTISVYNLPCDSVQEYETIRKTVTKKYYAEVDENNKKLDLLIEKSGLAADRRFDRNEFYKNKWKEWFGSANIIVYNRFIEKTIFK